MRTETKQSEQFNSRKSKNLAKMQKHGKRLLNIFPDAREKDPVKLYRKLNCIERRLAILRNDNDIGVMFDIASKILGCKPDTTNIILRSDPRGYAGHLLKIDRNEMLEKKIDLPTDFRGDGIIAPAIQKLH